MTLATSLLTSYGLSLFSDCSSSQHASTNAHHLAGGGQREALVGLHQEAALVLVVVAVERQPRVIQDAMVDCLADSADDLHGGVNDAAVRTDACLPDETLQTLRAAPSCEVPGTAFARVLAQRMTASSSDPRAS